MATFCGCEDKLEYVNPNYKMLVQQYPSWNKIFNCKPCLASSQFGIQDLDLRLP